MPFYPLHCRPSQLHFCVTPLVIALTVTHSNSCPMWKIVLALWGKRVSFCTSIMASSVSCFYVERVNLEWAWVSQAHRVTTFNFLLVRDSKRNLAFSLPLSGLLFTVFMCTHSLHAYQVRVYFPRWHFSRGYPLPACSSGCSSACAQMLLGARHLFKHQHLLQPVPLSMRPEPLSL